MATQESAVVEMRGIGIEFPGVKALEDVDFRNVYSTVARNWWGLKHDLYNGRARTLDFV